MSGFFKGLFGRVFGDDRSSDLTLPDDGGLADFAKQYARELEEEAKQGKEFSGVAGQQVLSVQQGRKGARVNILDTTDFKTALMPELRASVVPICEGVLRKRCGEKGVGYMHVKTVFVFYLQFSSPDEEYNAAMDVIDDIGVRLLGNRYISGEKRPVIGLACTPPSSLFKKNGEFNYRKAKRACKLVREAQVSGLADIDWQKQTVLKPVKPKMTTKEMEKKKRVDPAWEKFEASHKVKSVPLLPSTIDTGPPPATKKRKDVPTKPTVTAPAPKKQDDEVPSRHIDKIEPNDLTLLFRPAWQAAQEEVNMFAASAFRKTTAEILAGREVYDGIKNKLIIAELDRVLAKQAAHHIEQAAQIWKKRIVLPFHIESLTQTGDLSPLSPLHQLKLKFRKNIWIEIIGVDFDTMEDRLQDVLILQEPFFKSFGVRLGVSEASRHALDHFDVQFIACDLEELSANSATQTSLEQELSKVENVATAKNIPLCVWGTKNRKQIVQALKHQAQYVSGRLIGPQSVKIGKLDSLTSAKLLKR